LTSCLQTFLLSDIILGKDSYLVHTPDFEITITKIQLAADQGKANAYLTAAEKAAVELFADTGLETEEQSATTMNPVLSKKEKTSTRASVPSSNPFTSQRSIYRQHLALSNAFLVDVELLCVPIAV